MNLPNKLTVIRILLVPLLIIIYVFPYAMFSITVPIYTYGNSSISLVNIIVLVVFIIASITDYFDGKIARKENLITTFGKFADPIADKLLINTIFLLLASDRTISMIIPIIMISRDVVVDAIRLMAANQQTVISASMLGKLKTVTQMVAVVIILMCNFPFSIINLPMDTIAISIATVISIISCVDYFIKSRLLLLKSM